MSRAVGRSAFFDRYTAFHHLRAVAGLGVLSGVFLLNAEFAVGTLGATPWQVLALMLIPALAQTLVVIRNPVDPRRGWIRRPFRRLVIPVHLLLLLPLLGLLPAAPWPFILLVAGCSAVQMLTVPVQNAILARNYAPATRGRRFGTANAIHALALVAVALPAGWLLDAWPGSWRWLYALAGPGVTLGMVRGASQIARNDLEVDLLSSRWADKGVTIQPAVFELGGAGPMSWQLSAAEKTGIHDAFTCRDGSAVDAAICEKNEAAAQVVRDYFK